MYPRMKSTFRIGRASRLIAVLAVTALTVTSAASATTGIERSVPVRVVLTDSGAVWTPAISKLHPDTDTTFEIKVINKTTQPHSFKIGYRETKLLPSNGSQFFYYSFHLIGQTSWQVRHGNVQGSGHSGKLTVKLQKSFSGGEAG
jgi:hypothetical protein